MEINNSEGIHILLLGCMSSGKSTILNALLGSGIFPAGNRATTAQVFKVVHDPDCTENVCRSVLGQKEWQPLTKKLLEACNSSKSDKLSTEVRVLMPFLQKRRSVVFYDTPGPNTSKHGEHREKTYYALENLPVTNIFLVLDMAQLHTRDEEELLKDIGRVVLSRGEDMSVLVLLNKADVIDIEKESVKDIMADVHLTVQSYLPASTRVDVLPLMAKGAEVWRRMVARDNMTVFEVEFGQYIDWRLCLEGIKNSMIPEKIRESMLEQLDEWEKMQKFSKAFKSTLDYLSRRVHPGAELINKNMSKILDYADCRRAIVGSGIVALEEYIDAL